MARRSALVAQEALHKEHSEPCQQCMAMQAAGDPGGAAGYMVGNAVINTYTDWYIQGKRAGIVAPLLCRGRTHAGRTTRARQALEIVVVLIVVVIVVIVVL